MSPIHRPISVRTVFLSDIHLGSRDCRAELLLDFLANVQAEELILVGDIVDIWSLRRSPYWPSSHSEVLRSLFAKGEQGARLVFVPGNHDEQFRKVAGTAFGQIEVHREYLHETRLGQRLLVVHGDEFDAALTCPQWLTALGCGLYDVALGLNRALNRVRHRCGYGYWSLAGYLKNHLGDAMRYVHRFEAAAAQAAKQRGLDGIVCGHIHRPALHPIDGVLYCNDGDWVDSCSALVEHCDGELQLWNWAEVARHRRPLRRLAGLATAA